MSSDLREPPPRANKVYVTALSATAIATICSFITQFFAGRDFNEMRTDVTVLKVQSVQTNETLKKIEAALVPLTDGDRERARIEKVIRDIVPLLVKDEALRQK